MITTYATRIPGALISPGGRNGRLSILIFHRVLPRRDDFLDEDITVDTFRWQMQLLARHFNVLPLPEALRRLSEGSLPTRAACITFDDGYADNAEVALPVLQEFGLTATIFVASGFLDGGCMWNDKVCECIRNSGGELVDLSDFGLPPLRLDSHAAKRQAVNVVRNHFKHLPLEKRQLAVDTLVARTGVQTPSNLMLTSSQLRTLCDAGMEIGGHTVNHPILNSLTIDEAGREIIAGKERIESIIQSPVNYFAYPNGRPDMDYDVSHVNMLRKAGFLGAVTTMPGVSRRNSDCYQLPRFTPWDKTPMRFLVRLFLNCMNSSPKVAR